ncbi:PIG-L family deacetylase [Hymenobacter sp. GOD-10R]|uniref:PIG-L family deacetylase n=1 Tax=Hymenobacter sp. GOD-10R TaxID=3093922 RepID=UPI002D7870F9|nr:PIG-L family deacetylase [Hymenobacter sp. GOD-10R]WRQ27296.1 PIG-L family deacetylase [Hymenobacter sp. GOD-10R]
MRLHNFRAAVLLLLLPLLTHAQTPKHYTSADIALGLRKLNVLGSVLYIAAHPDDENTRLIAYMANGRLLETGYLACTRGDGGQNLIGPEIREQLGVIRTQELLAARRTDGGRQFFTRANDFGFSKTAEETFTIWDKEQVLADMVWVIRQRRPDVLITRFPPDARAGHGHHTASAILAAEAFDAAGDPKRFPEQLKYVQAWQPKRLLWNTGSFFVKPGESMTGYLSLDAGGYNAFLGQSYGEIAATSRSNHKSQGFGSAATRGEALEYFQPVKGEKAAKDPFEGVDMTWNRVPGGVAVGKLIDDVIKKYDPANPSASVAGLVKVRAALSNLPALRAAKQGDKNAQQRPEYFWLLTKEQQTEQLIQACLGLYLEATATTATVAPGQTATITVEAINQSASSVAVRQVWAEGFSQAAPETKELKQGQTLRLTLQLPLSTNSPVSQPYWLVEPGTVGMYAVPAKLALDQADSTARTGGSSKQWLTINRQNLIGRPESPASIGVTLEVVTQGISTYYTVPVQYKHTDPVQGELYQPLTVVPTVAVNIGGKAYVFSENQPKTVPVTVRAGRDGVRGTLALALPAGWKSEPASASFDLGTKDQERTIQFQVQPTGSQESAGQLRAVATVDGQQYSRGIQTIAYNHIPTQTLFPEAVAPLVKVDLKRKGQQIGYLMGAGDEVPDALRQVGYTVTLLKETDITPENLRRFDAVLLGVRAYNVLDRLKVLQPILLDYVKDGGNLVVEYVVNRGTVMPQIGPYPFTLSTDRVTVENAPVTFLKPQHPLLNAPNKISAKDFEGWVQEQGLYYPSQWDEKYQTIISSHDPNEKPKESAILVADYGKGHYIYTGLSFFRELPAGVPGAYRLLTNMISLGK